MEQTSDTAAGLRGTVDPHCLPTRGPAPFILDATSVTISTPSTMVSKNPYSWAHAQTPLHYASLASDPVSQTL